MSSNRANASARQRRAGEPVTSQSSQQQNRRSVRPGQQTYQEEPQKIQNPKLSVSDAIALITLRLGRVENIVQNYQNDPNFDGMVSSGNENNENMRMVDQNVFNSIATRLDSLEKNQKILIEKQRTLVPPSQQTNSKPHIQETTIVNDVSEEKMKNVYENIDNLKEEIVEIKDLLIKLQSFTMETNQKLVDAVFNEEELINKSYYISNQNIDDDNNLSLEECENDEKSNVNVNTVKINPSNLKELIKMELESEEVINELEEQST